MAMKQMLHTPEGVRDIYGKEFSRKQTIESGIRKVMCAYGYNGIQPPMLEFFDIFKKERGSVSSQEMFKLFDTQNNTLVLRPDMTPSVVRCASKYYTPEDLPVRLYYTGSTFINDRSYRLRLKECTDAGIELFGDGSVEADAEVIACMIDCLLECGLKDFQVTIGNAAFLNGLFDEIGFSDEKEAEIRQYLINKNLFVLDSVLKKENLTDRQREVFKRLQNYSGTIEQVLGMEALLRNDQSKAAVKRLKSLYKILGYYDMQKYVSFDLGMVTNYQYYTGIIFAAYTYGSGNQIVSGGRYDTLMSQFSYDAPAVGFKISVDGLMTALDRQNIDVAAPLADSMMLVEPETSECSIRLAAKLRKNGSKLAMLHMDADKKIDDYSDYAKRFGYQNIYYINRPCTTVTVLNPETGDRRTVELAEFMEEA